MKRKNPIKFENVSNIVPSDAYTFGYVKEKWTTPTVPDYKFGNGFFSFIVDDTHKIIDIKFLYSKSEV